MIKKSNHSNRALAIIEVLDYLKSFSTEPYLVRALSSGLNHLSLPHNFHRHSHGRLHQSGQCTAAELRHRIVMSTCRVTFLSTLNLSEKEASTDFTRGTDDRTRKIPFDCLVSTHVQGLSRHYEGGCGVALYKVLSPSLAMMC